MRIRIAIGLLVLFGIGGALHLPVLRPLLRRIGGCPVQQLTPAQVEAAQARAFHKLRGSSPAPQRPALGFKLEQTTLDDVRAWAVTAGTACESKRDGALLLCPNVPAAKGLPRYDELAFGFRLRDRRLVNLTALRVGLGEDEARSSLDSLQSGLEARLGPGDARPGAYAVFRFSDYLAEVSAMALPGRGHALREHYMSALE
jgi:hypothetical protein